MSNETKQQRSERARESKYMGSCGIGGPDGNGGDDAPNTASPSIGWSQSKPPTNHSWNVPRVGGVPDPAKEPAVETYKLPDTRISCRDFVLRSANAAINGPRQDSYGPPGENFSNIAKLWSVYLDYTIMPEDVAMLMILLKAARAKNGEFNLDTYVDIAGYAALGAEVATEVAW